MPAEAPAATSLSERSQIPDRFKWDLTGIFPDWNAWQTAYDDLDRRIQAFAGLEDSLAKGTSALLAAFKLRDEIVNIGELVDSCIGLVEPQAMQGKLSVKKHIPSSLPNLMADEVRVRQILINLLSNAVKFTPEGGSVQISAAEVKGSIAITVKDTGIGIPRDQIKKVLEAFHQIDSKISRKYEGTGLGLPLTKHLVELHGGALKVESALNLGTTVTFTIPPTFMQSARNPDGGSKPFAPATVTTSS